MSKQTRFHILYWIIAFFGVIALQHYIAAATQVAPIPYSRFEQLLEQGKVAEAGVSDRFIQGRLKAPIDGKSAFVTTRVDPQIAASLRQHGVVFTGQVEDNFLRDLVSWVAPTLLFFGLWMWLGRQGQAGLMQIGRSQAKVYVEANTGVTFADVAGVDEAKAELVEVIDFLKNPAEYGRLGGRMPKGVLLVGPPGTGKTLLAKAVAGEAKVPFFSISGSEFVEMFVGVGAARVRDLFREAREKAPAIIFIDELDALGRARGLYAFGGHDEKEQTLNQLLVEMDGFDSSSGLVLLAATNRPEILDPALLRAGRFDRQVLVDRPDKKGRLEILKVHVRKARLGPEVDLDEVAAITPGFSGADLANLVNEAALLATRRRAQAIAMTDFNEAMERIVAGLEKRNRLLNPQERQVVAHHEMGHALVGLALPGVEQVHKVSIIPRGVGALGYTIQRPTEDRFLMTREELENKMCALLGGRAAEQLIFGHLSTGAADDLRKVTDIARSMVTRYGMSERLGPVSYDREPRSFLQAGDAPQPYMRERDFGEATSDAIDEEVRRIIEAAFQRTLDLLRERRPALEEGARRLLEKETLEADELAELAGSATGAQPPQRRATAA
jgi:cell division protease FtsH